MREGREIKEKSRSVLFSIVVATNHRMVFEPMKCGSFELRCAVEVITPRISKTVWKK